MVKIRYNLSDDVLVIKLRNDNEKAFKDLFDKYSKKLYYFSLRYLRDKEESEELVQTVFINLWIHRKSLREDMPVKSYIYRSAVNYIFNQLKKRANHAKFMDSELSKCEISSNLTYEQVLFNDMERSINSIIETLPLQQKTIFILSRYENLSHQEIAEKLDLSVRTVENQVFRALKIIRSKLQTENIFLIMLCESAFINTLLEIFPGL